MEKLSDLQISDLVEDVGFIYRARKMLSDFDFVRIQTCLLELRELRQSQLRSRCECKRGVDG